MLIQPTPDSLNELKNSSASVWWTDDCMRSSTREINYSCALVAGV
jgi:hypothetical protein